MISVNRRAGAIVARMIDDREALDIEVRRLPNGATVLDAGIGVRGSLEAGRLLAEACLGGLASVGFSHRSYGPGEAGGGPELRLPAVEVDVCLPHIACMASQYAGWPVRAGDYAAVGSGPARALAAFEEVFRNLGYRDASDTAVLVLEGRRMPDAEVAAAVAERCGVPPGRLFLLAAPTASLAGSVQIAARSAETGMHKLAQLGFDLRKVHAAAGSCPLAPVAEDDAHAVGRTNDAILYGSEVFFAVEARDAELAPMVDALPSSASRDYGTPFYELFRRCGGDFYRIDPLLFSPARAVVNNLSSGRTYSCGSIHPGLLRRSLLES